MKLKNSRTLLLSVLVCVISLFLLAYKQRTKDEYSAVAQEDKQFKKGEDLFVKNCLSCHCSDMKSICTAPPLGGVTKKRNQKWLYKYTRYSYQMYLRGDPIAKKNRKENGGLMPSFPFLTNDNLGSIYYFVEKRYEMTLRGEPVKRYFLFDQKENKNAKVCKHVLEDKKAILNVIHTKSKEWYFSCDKVHLAVEWTPTTLYDVFNLDETISDVSFLGEDFIAKRKTEKDEWDFFMK